MHHSVRKFRIVYLNWVVRLATNRKGVLTLDSKRLLRKSHPRAKLPVHARALVSPAATYASFLSTALATSASELVRGQTPTFCCKVLSVTLEGGFVRFNFSHSATLTALVP